MSVSWLPTVPTHKFIFQLIHITREIYLLGKNLWSFYAVHIWNIWGITWKRAWRSLNISVILFYWLPLQHIFSTMIDICTYVKKTYIRVYVHYLYRIIMKTIEENLRFLPLCQNDIMEKSVSVLIKQISIFS